MRIPLLRLSLCLAAGSGLPAAPLTITLPATTPTPAETFTMGAARAPDGTTLTLGRRSLLLDGRPWTPVMGEFHFSRYPENEWREELLKMKAGGIDIVATYIFWIHHEEIQGQWEWNGDKSLRQFIRTAGEVGLKAIVRAGPWCHGEVRNGGLPDWIVARGHDRSENPAFLAGTKSLYEQIAAQLQGLLWKDGGPVIGIQFDNEYGGPAEYLLALKKIARAAGLDVPLYTRTGWPALRTPMPFGEIVPLYGVYAEGFWDRELTSMPGDYWAGFHFSTRRVDANIANEALGRRDAQDAPDVARYPYLTCEIGGGMMSSYHRRILVDPRDVESTTLVKLGSGSISPGYYMYHGGTNPEGKLTTLMEEQAAPHTNWNDLPVKNYDFQTALGQYGQVRPQYHLLRMRHLFLHDFGGTLAGMDTVLPDQRPAGKDDINTLRWAVRSDGHSGFIFVNNYERGRNLPAKEGVQFALKLSDGSLLNVPSAPVKILASSDRALDRVSQNSYNLMQDHFIWPFNLGLGHGINLIYATAQPLCFLDEGEERTCFFAESPGIRPEFAFADIPRFEAINGEARTAGRQVNIGDLRDPSNHGQIIFRVSQSLKIVVLNTDRALGLWKGNWPGHDRVFLTYNPQAGLVIDGPILRLTTNGDIKVGIMPAVASAPHGLLTGFAQGTDVIFQILGKEILPRPSAQPTFELLHPAGPLRKIEMGKSQQPVAAAPTEADFANAAVWRIRLPADLDWSADTILRLHYVGDVARVYIGGKLITDDFYNGRPFEIGLRRHAAALKNGALTVAILPLRKNAPIFLPDSARPDFGAAASVVTLTRAELVSNVSVELTVR